MDNKKALLNGGANILPVTAEDAAQGYAVFTGERLIAVTKRFENQNRRNAVFEILDRLKNYQAGKVCVVRGIRRTGKTTAILHAIGKLIADGVSADSVSYITVTANPESSAGLAEAAKTAVLNILGTAPREYIFIDEITNLPNILADLKMVSDVYALSKKIVLSGTDSYVWPLAATDALYGRMTPVDLTYMSFKEYCEVFPARMNSLGKAESVAHFCKFGGVLDRDDYAELGSAFRSIQTSLVANIVSTVSRNKSDANIAHHIGALNGADRKQLATAAVVAILTAANTQKISGLSTQDKKIPELAANILTLAGESRDGQFRAEHIPQDIIAALMSALIELNVFDMLPNLARTTDTVQANGGMVYACHISSLYSTIIGAADANLSLTGPAMENLILSQCVQFIRAKQRELYSEMSLDELEIGHCRYDQRMGENNKTPEIDAVITRRNMFGGVIFRCAVEIKTRETPDTALAKNFFLPSLEEALGEVHRYIVVYMGETKTIREVNYVSAYDFLSDMGEYITINTNVVNSLFGGKYT